MNTQPLDGTVYKASDGNWYRWPDPTPYESETDAASSATAGALAFAPPPPAYQQPAYQQPAYQQPAYQQPGTLPAAPSWNTGPAEPKKKHTVRNVLLAMVGGFILLLGGCMALIGGAANEISKDIEEDANKPGGTDNPLTIVAGQAFEVDGFTYAAGWTVSSDALGHIEIAGLKVTNNRDDRDSAIVEIKFWSGTEVLASADCSTEPIVKGTTVTLNCFSTNPLPAAHDKITINDTF